MMAVLYMNVGAAKVTCKAGMPKLHSDAGRAGTGGCHCRSLAICPHSRCIWELGEVSRLTCSRSGLHLPAEEAATLTAVTLVMNESMGSTASFVTAMMNASQVARSSFSSSFLLSTCA